MGMGVLVGANISVATGREGIGWEGGTMVVAGCGGNGVEGGAAGEQAVPHKRQNPSKIIRDFGFIENSSGRITQNCADLFAVNFQANPPFY